MAHDPLCRLEKLSQGTFGYVFKGVYVMNDEFVAIKYLKYLVKGDIKYKKAVIECKLMQYIENKTPKNLS